MFPGLLEAQKEAQNSYTLLQEGLTKQLQSKIDDQTLINKAISENLREVEKINVQKRMVEPSKTPIIRNALNEDPFGKLAIIFASKIASESNGTNIADEIMEEFVFETSKPAFEAFKRSDRLKALKERIQGRLRRAESWEEQATLWTDWIQGEVALQQDVTYAFLANESEVTMGPLTLQVRLAVPEFPAGRFRIPGLRTTGTSPWKWACPPRRLHVPGSFAIQNQALYRQQSD
jgi:hypothetical protein